MFVKLGESNTAPRWCGVDGLDCGSRWPTFTPTCISSFQCLDDYHGCVLMFFINFNRTNEPK